MRMEPSISSKGNDAPLEVVCVVGFAVGAIGALWEVHSSAMSMMLRTWRAVKAVAMTPMINSTRTLSWPAERVGNCLESDCDGAKRGEPQGAVEAGDD